MACIGGHIAHPPRADDRRVAHLKPGPGRPHRRLSLGPRATEQRGWSRSGGRASARVEASFGSKSVATVGLTLERQPRTVRVDSHRRGDHRQSHPRSSHPRPDHQSRDTPLGRPGVADESATRVPNGTASVLSGNSSPTGHRLGRSGTDLARCTAAGWRQACLNPSCRKRPMTAPPDPSADGSAMWRTHSAVIRLAG
jgi:hypothetical protein